MSDLPNCPLCGGASFYTGWAGLLYCTRIDGMRHMFVSDGTPCIMPPVNEDQLRALAALRKPITRESAVVLVYAACGGETLKPNAAVDALMYALTGKR